MMCYIAVPLVQGTRHIFNSLLALVGMRPAHAVQDRASVCLGTLSPPAAPKACGTNRLMLLTSSHPWETLTQFESSTGEQPGHVTFGSAKLREREPVGFPQARIQPKALASALHKIVSLGTWCLA